MCRILEAQTLSMVLSDGRWPPALLLQSLMAPWGWFRQHSHIRTVFSGLLYLPARFSHTKAKVPRAQKSVEEPLWFIKLSLKLWNSSDLTTVKGPLAQ